MSLRPWLCPLLAIFSDPTPKLADRPQFWRKDVLASIITAEIFAARLMLLSRIGRRAVLIPGSPPVNSSDEAVDL
jgi:hypothetical protein